MSRYAIWSVFGPVAWVAWLVVLAALALLLRGQRGWRFARAATVTGALLAVAIYVSPLGYVLIEPLETAYPVRPAAASRATDIIVLAGGERLSQSLRYGTIQSREHGERVVEAAKLARTLPAARLWAVGGVTAAPGTPRDVDWMAGAWAELGVPPARIRKITDTRDTCENAGAFRSRLPKGARPLLVTSAFHMPRAMACFERAGVEPLPYPVDFQNGPVGSGFWSADLDENADRVNLALHEYAGLVFYRLSGRTERLWPVHAPVVWGG